MGLPDVHGDDWQITQYVKGATYTLHTDCLMSEELEDKPEGLKMDRLATVLVCVCSQSGKSWKRL